MIAEISFELEIIRLSTDLNTNLNYNRSKYSTNKFLELREVRLSIYIS